MTHGLRQKIRFSAGIIISLVIIAIPMFGWKLWYSFEELTTFDAFLISFAKIGAFGGLAMFAMSLILSGRYSFYERIFGGLDKVYLAHRFYGTAGLALLVIHPLALNFIVNDNAWSSLEFFTGFSDITILMGAISLYGFIALIIWTIVAKVTYETFLKVHKLLGPLFILGAVHAFISGSVIASSAFIAFYLAVLCSAATITYVLYTLLGDIIHTPLRYNIESIKTTSDNVVEVILRPKRVFLKFSPGQFAYVCFPDIDSTYHPFSIASGRYDGSLRFAIRKSGDYTSAVSELKTNSQAYIKGPYGGFTFFQNRHKKQLWIAGGIGVTPFLSGARSLRRSYDKGKIEMIYASEEKHPYGLKELQKIEHQNPTFNVTHFHREKFGHVSLEVLQEQFKDLHERVIYLCGPPIMTKVLTEEAQRLGLQNNIQFEEFTYK